MNILASSNRFFSAVCDHLSPQLLPDRLKKLYDRIASLFHLCVKTTCRTTYYALSKVRYYRYFPTSLPERALLNPRAATMQAPLQIFDRKDGYSSISFSHDLRSGGTEQKNLDPKNHGLHPHLDRAIHRVFSGRKRTIENRFNEGEETLARLHTLAHKISKKDKIPYFLLYDPNGGTRRIHELTFADLPLNEDERTKFSFLGELKGRPLLESVAVGLRRHIHLVLSEEELYFIDGRSYFYHGISEGNGDCLFDSLRQHMPGEADQPDQTKGARMERTRALRREIYERMATLDFLSEDEQFLFRTQFANDETSKLLAICNHALGGEKASTDNYSEELLELYRSKGIITPPPLVEGAPPPPRQLQNEDVISEWLQGEGFDRYCQLMKDSHGFGGNLEARTFSAIYNVPVAIQVEGRGWEEFFPPSYNDIVQRHLTVEILEDDLQWDHLAHHLQEGGLEGVSKEDVERFWQKNYHFFQRTISPFPVGLPLLTVVSALLKKTVDLRTPGNRSIRQSPTTLNLDGSIFLHHAYCHFTPLFPKREQRPYP